MLQHQQILIAGVLPAAVSCGLEQCVLYEPTGATGKNMCPSSACINSFILSTNNSFRYPLTVNSYRQISPLDSYQTQRGADIDSAEGYNREHARMHVINEIQTEL